MSEARIDYENLVQSALRSVIKGALARAVYGLPGDHHFYISFKTQAPGVQISESLLAQFPDELTIVLQHRFWELKIEDDHFSVLLEFGTETERLVIPFEAISRFTDPSVAFALAFHVELEERAPDQPEPSELPAEPAAEADASPVVSLDAFRNRRE